MVTDEPKVIDKDCIDCKHSFYEDLDNNLCCELKNDQILRGVLDEDFKNGIPCTYDYSYPNVCKNFESMRGVNNG